MKSIQRFLNENLPLIFLSCIGLGIIVALALLTYSDYSRYKHQKIIKNYILHTNVFIINSATSCNTSTICTYTTNKGDMSLNTNVFNKLTEKQQFDIGLSVGTCYSTLYAKIYTKDVLNPYYIEDVIMLKHDSEQYKFYANLLKLTNQQCD